jgi:hypothetical protein
MANLPRQLPWEISRDRWASAINPFLANPTNNISILNDVKLINGVTIINHLLGQTPQGWFITDINGAATVYRSAPYTSTTLTLTSSAAVTVSIGVF